MFQGFVTSATALLASAVASATGTLTNLVGGAASDSATQTSLISERPVGSVEDSGRANGHSPLHRDVFIPARSSTSQYAPISGSPRPSGPRDDIFSSGQRMAPAFGLPLFAPLSIVLWSGVVGKMWRNITQGPSEKIHDLSRSISAEDLRGDTPPRALTKLLSFLKGSDLQLRYVAAEAILHLPWEGDNPYLSVAERTAIGLPWEGGNPHLLSPDEWLMMASPFYDGLLREHITHPDANRGPSSLAPSNRLLRLLTILFEGNHADARTILHSIIHAGLPYAPVPGRVLLDRILARQETPILQRLYVEILQVASFDPDTVDTQETVRSDMDVWERRIFLTGPRGVDTFLRWHTFRYLVFRAGDTVTEKLGLLAALNRLDDTDLNNFLLQNSRCTKKYSAQDPLIELVGLARDWIATGNPLPKEEADGLVRLLSASREVRGFFDPMQDPVGDTLTWNMVKDSWKVLEHLFTRADLTHRDPDHVAEEAALLNTALSVARRATITATEGEDAEGVLAEMLEIRRTLAWNVANFFERRRDTLSTEQILTVWVPAVILFANSPDHLRWLYEPNFITELRIRYYADKKFSDPSVIRALMILAQYEDRPEFAVYDLPRSAQALLREFDAAYDPAVWVEGSFRGTRWEDRVELGAYDFVALGGGQVMVRDEPGEPIDMGGEHVVVGSASDYARTERE